MHNYNNNHIDKSLDEVKYQTLALNNLLPILEHLFHDC